MSAVTAPTLIPATKIGRKINVFLQESHLLFRNITIAEFMRDLYKRARKYGGINTSITQNIEDLMTNDVVRTMISNSNFVVMLRQKKSGRSVAKA